jgi:rSAM/selenodomain-associated transferase 1
VLTGCVTAWAVQGDQTRRVGSHLVLFGLAFVAYLVALHAARGLSVRGLRLAVGVAVLWRLALVPAFPLLSDDVFRYVWEGRVQVQGGNPYAWGDRPESPRWEGLRDGVWRGVTHREYTAVYPPLWEMACRLVVGLHDSVAAMKAFVVACELGLMAVLARMLRRRRLPRERLLILAWSPLALVEVAGSGHNDAVAALLLTASLAALDRGDGLGSAVLAALGAQTKVLPALVGASWLRRYRWWHVVAALDVALLLFIPYAAAGPGLWMSLGKVGRYWLFNETLFDVLARLAGGHEEGVRLAGALLAALALLLAARKTEPVTSALLVVAASILLAPNVLPWYALWFLPLLVLRDAPGVLLFTGTVQLAYLVYPDWLSGQRWQVRWTVRALEYGPCVAVVLVAWLRQRAPRGRRWPPSMNDPNVLIVFVKAPRPGAVKTRLTPALSAVDAAELYRVLAEEEIRNTAPRPGEYTRLFFFDPSSSPGAMSEWLPEETLVPQRGDDLGARMSAAFDEAFRGGARRAAVIGTDVPWVTRALVAEAFAALGEHDVVLGPTADGGYYLLATDRPRPELFRGIAWSTPSVLASTVDRAGALGLKVRRLRPLADIDTIDDLRSHWDELRPLFAGRPVAAAVARALGR